MSQQRQTFNLGVIAAYSFLHFGAFLVVGLTFAWLANRVERARRFWLPAVVVFVLLEGLFLGTVVIVSGWVMRDLGWLPVLLGNLSAVIAMAAWIWHGHPKLREKALEQAVATRA